MADQTQGNGTAQNQNQSQAQGQGQGQNDGNGSQHQQQGPANGGQSQQLDVEQLTKKIEGLESLVGRFSNEVGSTRELKEEIQSLKTQLGNAANGQSSQNGQSQSDKKSGGNQEPQEDPLETITTGEQQKVDEAWKSLDADVRKNIYAEAKGKTPDEKQKSVTRRILQEIRTNEPVLPESLFGDNSSGQANVGDPNKGQQNHGAGTTADILKAIRGGNRQRPASGRQPQPQRTNESQNTRTEPQGPRPVAGGVFEAIQHGKG